MTCRQLEGVILVYQDGNLPERLRAAFAGERTERAKDGVPEELVATILDAVREARAGGKPGGSAESVPKRVDGKPGETL